MTPRVLDGAAGGDLAFRPSWRNRGGGGGGADLRGRTPGLARTLKCLQEGGHTGLMLGEETWPRFRKAETPSAAKYFEKRSVAEI